MAEIKQLENSRGMAEMASLIGIGQTPTGKRIVLTTLRASFDGQLVREEDGAGAAAKALEAFIEKRVWRHTYKVSGFPELSE